MDLLKGSWPGTRLTGYVDDYTIRRCDNCEYYTKGRCREEHVRRDLQVKKDSQGRAIVKAHGCCNYFESRAK